MDQETPQVPPLGPGLRKSFPVWYERDPVLTRLELGIGIVLVLGGLLVLGRVLVP